MTRLREIRTKRLMTQRELAEKAGVTHSTVSRIETGWQQNPSFRTVKRLATALGVRPEELTGK